MSDEAKPSAYERACREACPKGCGKGLRTYDFGGSGLRHFHAGNVGWCTSSWECTAPTPEAFIQAQWERAEFLAKQLAEDEEQRGENWRVLAGNLEMERDAALARVKELGEQVLLQSRNAAVTEHEMATTITKLEAEVAEALRYIQHDANVQIEEAEQALSEVGQADWESLAAGIRVLAAERDAAVARVAQLKEDRERLDWISCASREEIEDMLAHSVCDDVEDMCRFIDAARAKEAK